MDTSIIVGALGLLGTVGGILKARAEGRKAREVADAATDHASAKAVVELVAQLGQLRADLATEREARQQLEGKVAKLEAEREQDQAQVEAYAKQAAEAEKRARVMAEQLADFMLKGQPSTRSWRP
jgi:proteasome assembly chaperone (PAC2) family protein